MRYRNHWLAPMGAFIVVALLALKAEAAPLTPEENAKMSHDIDCTQALNAGKTPSWEVLRQQGLLPPEHEALVLRHQVAIGMSRCAATLAWGLPDYPAIKVIEKTLFVRDVWGYDITNKLGDKSLYFENMILYKIKMN